MADGWDIRGPCDADPNVEIQPVLVSHSSGSRVSAIAVDPFTSQNSMVTTRRSPSIALPARAASSLASSSL